MSDARIVIGAADQTRGAFAAVNANLSALGDRAAGLAGKLSAVTGAVASLAALNTLGDFIRGVTDGLDKLNDLKDATGASIGNISALEDVAARTGTRFDVVSTSLIKLNQALLSAKPGDDVSRTLQAIGLSAKQLRELDPAEALLKVAQGLAQFADDGNKARATQELFGKSLRDVAPLLADLAAKGQLQGTVTDEQAAAAERFNQQLAALAKNVEDAKRALVGDLLPSLSQTLEVFTALSQGPGFLASVPEVFKGNVFRTAGEAAAFYRGKVDALNKEIERYARMASDPRLSIQLSSQREIDKLTEQRTAVEKLLKAYEPLEKKGGRPGTEGGGKYTEKLFGDRSLKVPGKVEESAYDSYVDKLLETLRATQNLSAAEQLRVDIAVGKIGALTEAQEAYLLTLGDVIDASKKLPQLQGPDLDASVLDQRKRDADAIRRLIDSNPASQFDGLVRLTQVLIERMRQGDIAAEDYRRAMEALGKEFEALQPKFEQLSTFADQAARNIQDALGDSLLASMEGNFDSITRIWGSMLKRMVAQAAAADLARSLFGADFAKTGQIGGLGKQAFDFIGSLFGGARAAGGPVEAGRAYLVGEQGPEIVVPRQAGTVIPNGAALQAGPTYQVIVQGDASAATVRLINNALAQFEARRARAY